LGNAPARPGSEIASAVRPLAATVEDTEWHAYGSDYATTEPLYRKSHALRDAWHRCNGSRGVNKEIEGPNRNRESTVPRPEWHADRDHHSAPHGALEGTMKSSALATLAVCASGIAEVPWFSRRAVSRAAVQGRPAHTNVRPHSGALTIAPPPKRRKTVKCKDRSACRAFERATHLKHTTAGLTFQNTLTSRALSSEKKVTSAASL